MESCRFIKADFITKHICYRKTYFYTMFRKLNLESLNNDTVKHVEHTGHGMTKQCKKRMQQRKILENFNLKKFKKIKSLAYSSQGSCN